MMSRDELDEVVKLRAERDGARDACKIYEHTLANLARVISDQQDRIRNLSASHRVTASVSDIRVIIDDMKADSEAMK